jgi:tRNA(fMet)-specific endonuclease VapC
MSLRYLLDTDFCSEAVMGNRVAFTRLKSIQRDSWAISSLVFAELHFGIEKGKLRPDSQEALELFLLSATVVNFDKKAAAWAAKVRADLELKGKPSGAVDQMIAGHAISLSLKLVTNNLKHFEHISGLEVESWI